MERPDRLPLKAGYPAMVRVLFAGLVVSIAVTVATQGRASTVNPWIVGFGGTLLFVVATSQTVRTALMVWRSWQLRLFGQNTWAVLTDTQARSHGDMVKWTATVQGAGFTHVIDTGFRNPGQVGDRVPVRRHAASNQAKLLPADAPFLTLFLDIYFPFVLLLVAAMTAAFGYWLVRGAIDLLG